MTLKESLADFIRLAIFFGVMLVVILFVWVVFVVAALKDRWETLFKNPLDKDNRPS
jgi:hypothetical protein